jgi:RimJ/RimL family protein N-acetyltransferase
MTLPSLQTARLLLRPLTARDAPALVTLLNDWEVVSWLSVVPYPYTIADADAFVGTALADGERIWVIDAGGLVGVIGIGLEFGYWLARSAWGQGYATEAGQAVLALHFANPDAADVHSGYFPANARSARVLQKLGFVADGLRRIPCAARQTEMDSCAMLLTRAAWAARHA